MLCQERTTVPLLYLLARKKQNNVLLLVTLKFTAEISYKFTEVTKLPTVFFYYNIVLQWCNNAGVVNVANIEHYLLTDEE